MQSTLNQRTLIKKLISNNSSKACKAIGKIMYVVAAAYFVLAILLFTGVFKTMEPASYLILVNAVLMFFVGLLSEKVNQKGVVLRFFQIYLLLLTVFFLNVMTGFRVWIMFALPIVLSCRYYDRLFTIHTGVFAVFLAIATSFANAYLAPLTGLIDLNTVSFSQPGTLEYYRWLFNPVIRQGYDAETVLVNSIRLSALPNCVVIALIVAACCIYIKDAEDMLMESFAAAEKENEQILLKYYSSHDELTGLYNRRAYQERINTLKTLDGSCGVIFGDLNGLKYANDNFGHEAGDKLLVSYAEILSGIFEKDEIFRISGDEFICIVKSGTEAAFAERAAELEAVLNRQEPPLASIGSSFGASSDVDRLIKDAEARMYEKKELVHSRWPETKRV